jgi:hypothetical protein
MTFRIVNTRDAITGPNGICYIHDAARPFAVLFNKDGRGEMCALRCATEQAAKAAVQRFTEARARYAARQVAQ